MISGLRGVYGEHAQSALRQGWVISYVVYRDCIASTCRKESSVDSSDATSEDGAIRIPQRFSWSLTSTNSCDDSTLHVRPYVAAKNELAHDGEPSVPVHTCLDDTCTRSTHIVANFFWRHHRSDEGHDRFGKMYVIAFREHRDGVYFTGGRLSRRIRRCL